MYPFVFIELYLKLAIKEGTITPIKIVEEDK